MIYLYDETGSVCGLEVTKIHGETVTTDTYYFAKNLQGDVTAILDYQGNVLANYRYDAYGSIISVTDANGNYISSSTHIANLNPFRYRGYMYDEESGFYYLRSRYYDPYIGRFLNADGTVNTGIGFDGFNMFAYCNNNPIMLSDGTGCRPIASSSVSTETDFEHKLSFAYMNGYDIGVYCEILEKQKMLTEMGFSNITFISAKDYYNTIITAEINTPEREAHFLAQCYVEGGLSVLEAGYLPYDRAEAYRQKQPYYPYYGAGYIQVTWDYNYQAFSDYMKDTSIYTLGPEYVARYYAWSSAGWFWSKNRINEVIDNNGSVRDVTRIVNGGLNGLDSREAAYKKFLDILGG